MRSRQTLQTVAPYLSLADKNGFQNMSPNKTVVVQLYYQILTDHLPPVSSTTSQLFGFSTLREFERPSLLGLYQGLIRVLGCRVQEFLEAFENGLLRSLIESKFSSLPEGSRGEYYEWFLERRELFDGLKPLSSQRIPSVPPPSQFAATSWPNLKIITAFRPGDDLEISEEKIHRTVVDFLSASEKKNFKNMSQNKIAVVSLYHEVLKDYLPAVDSTTYLLFGYSKLNEMDHPALLGLYQGLIRILDCGIQEFLEAFENGLLRSLIESKFSSLPEGSRGNYYKWFLERRELFDGLKPLSSQRIPSSIPPSQLAVTSWPNLEIITALCPGDDPEASIEKIHRTVVRFLSASEKRNFKNMSQNKVAVVALYYEVLKEYLPAVDSTTYLLFGYSKLNEMDHPALLGLYQGLIRILGCGIQEFLEAFKNGLLRSLIETKFSSLPEGSRGNYYEWFLERRELFDGLKPLSSQRVPSIPPSQFAVTSWPNLKIATALHPGDDSEISAEKIHRTVVRFLSASEKRNFKNMSQNKVEVVSLYYAVLEDYLPRVDSTTYLLFGYSKLNEMDRPALQGLYQGLICHLRCKIQEFLEAFEQGKMRLLIESKFSTLTESARGANYRWFLERRELFDGLKPLTKQGLTVKEPKLRKCHVCNETSRTRCGRCKKVWYCTKEHQVADWKDHKAICCND